MSAVSAIWRFDGRPVGDDIQRMTSALRMYGPDGSDAWSEGGVGLGHCRMNLVPEDRGDRQPRTGGDGTMVLSAAGRLDNRDELGRALGLESAAQKGMPDSELLLRVLEAWGEEGIPRLIGSFAFAYWDRRRHRLICARDALGEYGLHYYRSDSLFAVASMPKGLHSLPDIPKRIDELRIARALLLLPGRRGGLFSDIIPLEPGSVLTASSTGIEIRRYWDFPAAGSRDPGSEDAAVEQLRELLDKAVQCRFRAIGGIGSHLSSGMDSGIVTATAARLLAAEGQRLSAFTSVPREGYDARGLDGRPGDEGPGAAAVAAMYPNIDHHLVRPEERTPLEGLDMAVQTMDHPPVNPCNLMWGDEIARQARAKRITVMLTGQMGNMTVSYHGREHLPEMLRGGHIGRWLLEVFHVARNRPRGLRMAVGTSLLPLVPRQVWRAYDRRRKDMTDPFTYTALAPEFAREVDYRALAADANWNLDYQPWVDGHSMRIAVLERVDLSSFSAGYRAAFGVDHRDPTMDRRVVEFCLALPTRYFLHRGIEKRILKRLARDVLPARTIYPKERKGYQAVDWHESLTRCRDEIAEEIERLEASPLASRCLDLPKLKRLVDDWPTGGWHTHKVTQAYRLALLRGLAMGRFIRRMEGGNQ